MSVKGNFMWVHDVAADLADLGAQTVLPVCAGPWVRVRLGDDTIVTIHSDDSPTVLQRQLYPGARDGVVDAVRTEYLSHRHN